MKYTIEIRLKNIKLRGKGYAELPNRIYRHVEANNEAEAKKKAVEAVDPYLTIENVEVVIR